MTNLYEFIYKTFEGFNIQNMKATKRHEETWLPRVIHVAEKASITSLLFFGAIIISPLQFLTGTTSS